MKITPAVFVATLVVMLSIVGTATLVVKTMLTPPAKPMVLTVAPKQATPPAKKQPAKHVVKKEAHRE